MTILNNVVNPLKQQRTAVVFSQQTAGQVTIQVFNLAGDLVKVLQDGVQGVGNYTYTWDGKDTGGHVVARGIYFIRIVAPGVDEYRKVLIVK